MDDVGGYDGSLVVLSVFIAIAASYTALDLATRIAPATGAARRGWLIAAALVLGSGIWSMHFIGMLAYSMPMPVTYDTWQTLASFAIALIATGSAFHVVNRRSRRRWAVVAGLLMGFGIVGMHYMGMAAMRMQAHTVNHLPYVIAAITVAVVASTAAVWLAFRRHSVLQRLVASVALGIGISGMHYLAVAGYEMIPDISMPAPGNESVVGTGQLVVAVTASTIAVLFASMLAALYDRRFAQLAEREAKMLRESEERFRHLYRHTPLPLHSLDAQGKIQQVSDSWLELLGYAEGEVIGRPLTDFMTAESARRRLDDHWPRLIGTGELHEAEYTLLTKHGQEIECVLSAVVERDADGRLVKTLCGLVDVTQRRRAEAALRQSQKLEAVGQLTGGIAHDFNNLLAVIVGNLELARRRVSDDDRLRSLLENTMQAAQRGAALTQRMLAFARRQDLKPAPVDVPELVLGMADLLRRSIGPSVKIETRFPLGLPKALVDANQLELALLNLAVNARDAMPEGGAIVIEAGEEGGIDAKEGRLAKEPRFLCLSVSDTGTGMDEATLAHATEPFFTTKGVGKGTGLGLAMVHGLAAQSGGRLTLTSLPGQGTTASICLPIAPHLPREEMEPALPAAGQDGPEQEGIRVLVVDDDPLVLSATSAMLEDLGYAVTEAGSGRDALRLFDSGLEFDVVLTDHAMPAMTGVQLASKIREKFPSVPIILGTGYAQLPDGVATDLRRLAKPFSQDSLERTLRSAVQGRESSAINHSSRSG